jgi:hypothetical protein
MTGLEPLPTPFPNKPPCIGNMLDCGCAGGDLHDQQIKPVFIARTAVPENPALRHSSDVSLFSSAYRLESASIIQGTAGFDFDKGYQPTTANNQVDVMPAQPKPMRLDRPATGSEECDGQTLAFQTEHLALIFPLDGRNEPTSCAHAPQ